MAGSGMLSSHSDQDAGDDGGLAPGLAEVAGDGENGEGGECGALGHGLRPGEGPAEREEPQHRAGVQEIERRDSDALGRYSGPGYERWKGRNLEMQRKIDAVKFSNQIAEMNRQDEGLDSER